VLLFFFSSRRRNTSFSRDWSSDVCSSDLSDIEGDFRAGFQHHFHAAGQVGLLPCFYEQAMAKLHMLVARHSQVIVGIDLRLPVGMGGAVLLGQELGVAIGFDAVVAFVADADVLVVLDVLVPVALGVEEDLFFTGLVFDAQLVEAFATGAAEGFEDAAGFVFRQAIWDLMRLVVEAAGDQRLVGVAFEEADQHFHANPGDGDAAVAVAGPVAGDSEPATGLVVGLAMAVPVELDFDAAVLVAVDFFVVWAGDDGGLGAVDGVFGVLELGAVDDVPGGGGEGVAVALGEGVVGFPLSPAHYSPLRGSPFGPAFGCSALRLSHKGRGGLCVQPCSVGVCDRFFQYLWLFALVFDGG